MNIGISTEGIERANAVLKHIKGAFPRVLASTTNRVLEGMRTDIVAETKERYFVKPSEIRKTISLKKAGANNLQGIMLSRGARKSLADYNLTPKSSKKGMKSLKGAVKRDGIKNIQGGFLVKRGGKYKPYIRSGSGKWNINLLVSPAIPQILKNEDTVKNIEQKAIERFEKRLDHEILRALNLLP
ncbi:MAG: phage tail protein [Synergistaceae bacterium]|nr:phage tail protein [Synergistaceae bacterium]